jgi:hypothetical protein
MKKDPAITAIRARRETTQKLKILSALWHESIMNIVDRLVTREYDAIQGHTLPSIPPSVPPAPGTERPSPGVDTAATERDRYGLYRRRPTRHDGE